VRRVDEACQSIEGYHSLLATHLDLTDPKFAAAVDIAAKSKLLSLIVDNVDVAEKVI
jgi:chromosome segregation ATPase